MKKIEIKPGEPGQESLYYSDCNPDVRGACIGHLRMDFGDGNEFWSTWWQNNSDLKTEQFRSELDGVINGLRSSGLLKNRRAMMSYCSRHTNLNLGRSYGFKAETENYIFLLRCQPGEGYDCYCYCYDKRELQQIQSQDKSPEPGMNLSL